jgi:hypothetical protein
MEIGGLEFEGSQHKSYHDPISNLSQNTNWAWLNVPGVTATQEAEIRRS